MDLFNSIEDRAFQLAIQCEPARFWTPSEILEYSFNRKPYHQPGEKHRYSNTNTILLGLVIEEVTGKNWREAVEERLLAPGKLTTKGLRNTGALKASDGKIPSPSPSGYRFGRKDKVIGYGNTFYDVSHYSSS
jgi:D-alanyl-D-alanine carboxypeptidase